MDRLEREWLDFREKNPGLVSDLVRIARRLLAEAWARGQKPRRMSIALVWETARWEGRAVNPDGSPYRWNNSHRALAARAAGRVDPELGALFRTRIRASEKKEVRKALKRERVERAYTGTLV